MGNYKRKLYVEASLSKQGLCVEEQCTVQTDSPTCGKDVMSWVPEFTDIKSAFLQDELLD